MTAIEDARSLVTELREIHARSRENAREQGWGVPPEAEDHSPWSRAADMIERLTTPPPWDSARACFGHCDKEGWYSECVSKPAPPTDDEREALAIIEEYRGYLELPRHAWARIKSKLRDPDAGPLGSGHSPRRTGHDVGDCGGSVEDPSTHLIHGSASDDEREALAQVLWEAEVEHNPEGVTAGIESWEELCAEEPGWAEGYRHQADRSIAAGFRRQGPITDASQILREVAHELEAPNPAARFKWAPPARSWLLHRAALEAAERA